MRSQKAVEGALLLLLLAFTAGTALQTWQLLQSNPLSAPFLSGAALERALTRSLADTLTPALVSERLQAAIAREDLDTAQIYADLSQDPQDLRAFQAFSDEKEAFLNRTAACLSCTWDGENCETLSQMLLCKAPILLTPIEDVAVLSGAGIEALQGKDIDQFEVALSLVGLGATGLVLFTGGSSYTLKLGASALRAAKRMGALSPLMLAQLRALSDIPVNWSKLSDVLRARAPLSQMVDGARLAPLAALAQDAERLRTATSSLDALQLMRFADTPAELARVAHVAEAAGPQTRTFFEVLGKSRVLRLTARLSDEVLAAITGVLLLFGQIGTLLGSLFARGLLKSLRKSLAPSGPIGKIAPR